MILLDSSALVAFYNQNHPSHTTARSFIEQRSDNSFVIAPQCLYEMYAVATRPKSNRGFGLDSKTASELLI
jgi:predicted nucleic acid-binding protein